jgi:hypothetical protein
MDNQAQGRNGFILKLIFLVAVISSAAYLRWRAASQAPLTSPLREPIDFKLIQRTYYNTYQGKPGSILKLNYTEVERVLGPADAQQSHEPEYRWLEESVSKRRGLFPEGNLWWLKWTDPNDKNKWVAIFFIGDKSHYMIKGGF